eukprot:m.81502 g.81502  ORF g.81502 m.81502 type:complete len:55 (+) comp12637_c0_seq1:156-320(+)
MKLSNIYIIDDPQACDDDTKQLLWKSVVLLPAGCLCDQGDVTVVEVDAGVVVRG